MEGWRLVEDGICSHNDIDIAVTDGLAPRRSFMGPFQTIDCNANGVNDYCEKYGETITKICKEQEDSRKMKGSETAKIIENDILKITTLAGIEKLENQIAWRDMKLAEYTKYKNLKKLILKFYIYFNQKYYYKLKYNNSIWHLQERNEQRFLTKILQINGERSI